MGNKNNALFPGFLSMVKCEIIELTENQPQFLMLNLSISNITINLHNIDTIKIEY